MSFMLVEEVVKCEFCQLRPLLPQLNFNFVGIYLAIDSMAFAIVLVRSFVDVAHSCVYKSDWTV